jgi:hypothetical protein
VELPLTIAGNLQVLNAARGRGQVALVVPITISLALRTALSPPDADERIEFLTHHVFQHHANGGSRQITEVVLEFLLAG